MDYKGRQFLESLNSNLNPLKPSTKNGGLWLKQFGYFNSLCTRVIRAVVNHTPTSEYQLRFFSNKDIACLCDVYPIKTRRHIIYTTYTNLQ